jgi:hypothetical protein
MGMRAFKIIFLAIPLVVLTVLLILDLSFPVRASTHCFDESRKKSSSLQTIDPETLDRRGLTTPALIAAVLPEPSQWEGWNRILDIVLYRINLRFSKPPLVASVSNCP